MRDGRSRGTRGLAGAAVWLAVGLAPALARGQGAAAARPPALVRVSAQLAYVLGPGAGRCPGEGALRDEVARRLGYDPFAPGAGGKAMGRMRTAIARAPRGLRATTAYVGTDGAPRWTKTYEVKGTSARACQVAISGVAIQLATELTVFEDEPAAVVALPPDPVPAPLPVAPPEPAPPDPPPVPPPSPRARSLHPRLEVGAGVSAVFGMAPVAVASGTAHVGVQLFPFEEGRPWFSVAAELRGDVPASSGTAGTDIQTSMLAGSGLACAHGDLLAVGQLIGSVFTCAIGTGGTVTGQHAGSEGGASLRFPYVGLGARPGVEARFSSRAAIRLQAEVLGVAHAVHFAGREGVLGTSPASFGAGVAGVFLF